MLSKSKWKLCYFTIQMLRITYFQISRVNSLLTTTLFCNIYTFTAARKYLLTEKKYKVKTLKTGKLSKTIELSPGR